MEREHPVPNLSFLFFVDEIDAINSKNNINICPEGLSSRNPYERLYCLWTLLSIFLEKNIFLLVAGKSSSLSMIGKNLISISNNSRSPTRFCHISLRHLSKEHYELSLKNTKITVTHNSKMKITNKYHLTAYDALNYRVDFDENLVKSFLENCYIYSKGIPRILFNITVALLERKGKIKTEKEMISFIEVEALQMQKITDLFPDFNEKWQRDCFLRLLLFAVLEIPISIYSKFKIRDSYGFKTIPILELIANVSIFHENCGNDYSIDSEIVKLVIPKFTLVLLRKQFLLQLISTPAFILCENLMSRREIIDKGDLLQELTVQCIIAHFIALNLNDLTENSSTVTYGKYSM
jgi:hypothetical protein